MADIEDGYTRIANELLDAITQHNLTQRELKVLLAIIRKTYGYQKKTDDIATSQLSKVTGVHPNHVRATLKSLFEKNVILKTDGVYGSEIGVQKNHTEWKSKATKSVGKTNQNGCKKQLNQLQPNQLEKPTELVGESNRIGCLEQPNRYATKENLTKENKTKEKRKGFLGIELPDYLSVESIQEFYDYRKGMGKALSIHGLKLLLKQLDEFKQQGHDPVVILQTSIVNGWSGVFAPKKTNSAKGIQGGDFSAKQYVSNDKAVGAWT